jgi:hypothetical protein
LYRYAVVVTLDVGEAGFVDFLLDSGATAVERCTLCILLTHLLLVWLAGICVGQWEGWMMYVSANEKAVSLNLHRYAAALISPQLREMLGKSATDGAAIRGGALHVGIKLTPSP